MSGGGRWVAPLLAALGIALAPQRARALASPGEEARARAAASRDAGAEAAPSAAVARLLAPPADGQEPQLEELSAALVALGTRALPELCGLLTGSLAAPEEAHGRPGVAIHPRALELREDALRRALGGFAPAAVAAELGARARTEELSVRLACVRLLGGTACREAFDALLDAGAALEPVLLARTYVRRALEEALGAQLARDPRLASALHARLGALPQELWPCIAQAAGRARGPEAVELLAALLGRRGELDAVVVRALLACSSAAQVDLDHPLRRTLRGLLDAPEPGSRRAAADALGVLLDSPSAASLVGLLEDEDERVRASARLALVALGGEGAARDAEGWRAWLEGERRWLDEEGPAVREALASGDPARVHRALLALVAHPLHRHEAADLLRPVLREGSPDAVREAIGCAQALRSPRAVAPLARLWERSDDPAQREQAARALEALTGKRPEPRGRRGP